MLVMKLLKKPLSGSIWRGIERGGVAVGVGKEIKEEDKGRGSAI